MKREFTLDIDGQQVTVTAVRDGDSIVVTRDGEEYRVRVLAESVAGVQAAVQAPTGSSSPSASGTLAPASAPRSAAGGGAAASARGGGALAHGESGGAGAVHSPMTGVIDQVLVADGDAVEEGQVLVILEAMKMYIDILAPLSGTVANLAVAPGDTVKDGQPIVAIEAGAG